LSISRWPPWFLAINWSIPAIKMYCHQVLNAARRLSNPKGHSQDWDWFTKQTKKIQFVGEHAKQQLFLYFNYGYWLDLRFTVWIYIFFCCFTNYQGFFVNKRCFLRYWVIGLGYWGLKVGFCFLTSFYLHRTAKIKME
jgi:hypothetical protein